MKTAWLLLALSILASLPSPAAEEMPRVFLEKHCFDCHDATEKKGGIDLDSLKANFADAENFVRWVKVHDGIESGEMPPKKKARPPAAESAAFLGTLSKDLTLAEASKSAGGGRSTVRRMNRVEYENALRDLLALPLRPVKEMLPALPASGTANWGTTNGVRDYEGPGVACDWFEVEGPIVDQGPPEELEAGLSLRPFFCSLARGMAAAACLHCKE